MKTKILSTLAMLVIGVSIAWATPVKFRVLDASTREPLTGATLVATNPANSNRATGVADIDGYATLNVSVGDKLKIKYVGYHDIYVGITSLAPQVYYMHPEPAPAATGASASNAVGTFSLDRLRTPVTSLALYDMVTYPFLLLKTSKADIDSALAALGEFYVCDKSGATTLLVSPNYRDIDLYTTALGNVPLHQSLYRFSTEGSFSNGQLSSVAYTMQFDDEKTAKKAYNAYSKSLKQSSSDFKKAADSCSAHFDSSNGMRLVTISQAVNLGRGYVIVNVRYNP